MSISGPLPPPGGPSRAAQAYGIARKPSAPTADRADRADRADKAGTADKAEKKDGLRAVLSDEERAYFDQIAALGPITYGPGHKAGMVPDAPRGLRLDVRG